MPWCRAPLNSSTHKQLATNDTFLLLTNNNMTMSGSETDGSGSKGSSDEEYSNDENYSDEETVEDNDCLKCLLLQEHSTEPDKFCKLRSYFNYIHILL